MIERLILAPAAEPLAPIDLMDQLGLGAVSDPVLASSLNSRLGRFLSAARADCENYTRRVFIAQTWLITFDGFPGGNWRYNWRGYPCIWVPKPPIQSVDFFRYVDTAGEVQDLPLDTSYGNNSLEYGYQLVRGNDTAPGRIQSSWARPWPPTRMVPENVLLQVRCGYGGPLTVSMSEGSNIVTVSGGYKFNPADAPLLTADMGLAVSIPGAGESGSALVTRIASVDDAGVATLADAASTGVASVQGWFGDAVPNSILQAILFQAQWYYEQGSVVDAPMPQMIRNLLEPYVNRIA